MGHTLFPCVAKQLYSPLRLPQSCVDAGQEILLHATEIRLEGACFLDQERSSLTQEAIETRKKRAQAEIVGGGFELGLE